MRTERLTVQDYRRLHKDFDNKLRIKMWNSNFTNQRMLPTETASIEFAVPDQLYPSTVGTIAEALRIVNVLNTYQNITVSIDKSYGGHDAECLAEMVRQMLNYPQFQPPETRNWYRDFMYPGTTKGFTTPRFTPVQVPEIKHDPLGDLHRMQQMFYDRAIGGPLCIPSDSEYTLGADGTIHLTRRK